jgi:hypothetical protein
MKAVAVFPGKPNSIHLADLPVPSVNDVPDGRGVLVDVLRVGVDGTDKEIALLVFAFVTVALSFTYAWFYVASSGSVLIAAVLHASFNNFSDTFWVPPLLSGANPFAPSLVGGVLMLALMVVVYGVFRRSVRVEDPERFIHPKLDGT